MPMHKIQLRKGFSDRNKIEPINTQMQVTKFDQRTRTALSNLLYEWIYYNENYNIRYDFYRDLIINVFSEFFDSNKQGDINYNDEIIFKHYIHDNIINGTYHDVLTLAEYITQYYDDCGQTVIDCAIYNYKQALNDLFEKEYVGYRFVGDYIVAITDKVEVEAIEETLDCEIQVCKTHISNAVKYLADRENKDYKNSIKESISAVEAICRIITGKESAVLSDALKLLEKSGITLHSCLKTAFEKLYSYTSDEGGIRHSEKLFESNVTFDDAKYMLVSCCAFVNYLIPKYDSIKREEK